MKTVSILLAMTAFSAQAQDLRSPQSMDDGNFVIARKINVQDDGTTLIKAPNLDLPAQDDHKFTVEYYTAKDPVWYSSSDSRSNDQSEVTLEWDWGWEWDFKPTDSTPYLNPIESSRAAEVCAAYGLHLTENGVTESSYFQEKTRKKKSRFGQADTKIAGMRGKILTSVKCN